MRPVRFPLALAALCALALAAPAAAQSGKISGTVTDADGVTLPGVNVRIEGTTQGAATNVDGEYVIVGVRPGEYTVQFSFIGFQPLNVTGVRVRIDLTTDVDAVLQEEVLGGEEITVVATRPLFERDVTATTASVSGDEIRSLPLENFEDVLEVQAGVVEQNGQLHFRGGRAGEVGYWVDGVPVTDVYDGGLALEVENNSLQEVQVVTGAFNAEYGQALSGIVNIVTRDGSNDFEGTVSGFAGDYATGEGSPDAFSADAIGPEGRLALFPGTGAEDFAPAHVRDVQGSFSGPILRDRLFFFASGRYFGNDGSIAGRDVFSPDNVGFDPTGRLAVRDSAGTRGLGNGDRSLVWMNPYEKASGQLKLTLPLQNGMRLSANLLGSREDFRDSGFDLLLLPSARRQNERRARTAIFKLDHAVSNRTFYEVGVTNNFSTFESFLFEDPLDERYLDNRFFGFRQGNLASGFALGGTDNGRFSRTTDTWLLKGDVQSQVHPAHLVKTGVEARFHTLDFLDQFTFVQEDVTFSVDGEDRNRALFTNGEYRQRPVELAAYIQDKIEVGDLVINAGIRLDYFDSNGVVFGDPTDPNTVFPSLRRCQEVVNGGCTVDPVTGRELLRDDVNTPDELFEGTDAAWQISPRLGVAFPFSDTGVFHFSFGRFFQTPNFELLYQNPFFALGTEGSGLVGLIGNANLRPEQTTSGEIGLKQEITRGSALEVTAYYRDIRNLAGTATDPLQIAGTSARYGRLINSDFGIVRGVILRYDQRIGRELFAGADYTFQVARANAFDPAQVFNAAAAQGQLEQRLVPTPWDQRHTVNGSLSYQSARYDAGFGMVGRFGSGFPYTPVFTTNVSGGENRPTTLPLNSEVRPATFTLDLTAYKAFSLPAGQLRLFAQVDNLLDARNELNVFGDTGSAESSTARQVEARSFVGDPVFLAQRYTRPDFFQQPRRVVLGARVSF